MTIAICKTCGQQFDLSTGHDCPGLLPASSTQSDNTAPTAGRELHPQVSYSRNNQCWIARVYPFDSEAAAKDFARQALAAPPSTAAAVETADAEHFIQQAIDSAPEPLRRLGEFLAKVLDEDHWKTAERLLLGASIAPKAVEPTPGNIYRFLRVGEIVEAGDECPDDDCRFWEVVPSIFVGHPVARIFKTIRRKVDREEAIRQRDEALAREAAMRECIRKDGEALALADRLANNWMHAVKARTLIDRAALSQPSPETKAEGQGGGT